MESSADRSAAAADRREPADELSTRRGGDARSGQKKAAKKADPRIRHDQIPDDPFGDIGEENQDWEQ